MQHGRLCQNPKQFADWSRVCTRGPILNYFSRLIILLGVTVVTGTVAQNGPPALCVDGSSGSPGARDVMNRVIEGVKEAEREGNLYERIERVEIRKQAGDPGPVSAKAYRVVPAGTGTAKIPLGLDGKPTDQEAYRAELEKLLKSLTWAAETGQPQREAYLKVQRKLKERDEAIDATRNAFVFTF